MIENVIRRIQNLDPGPGPRPPNPDYFEITEEELRDILQAALEEEKSDEN
jgi:hypothetical protein